MQVRHDPMNEWFREMNRVHTELSQAFGRFVPVDGRGVVPGFNVWEDEHNVHAEADLPGVDVAKLDVTVTEGNVLTVQGERKAETPAGAVWHRQERGAGTFSRTLTLPTLVDADKVEAVYEAGVLRLTLPKAEAAKPRKIVVKGA